MEYLASRGAYIARQWRRGWDNIPVVMASQCVTVPLFIIGAVYLITHRNIDLPTEKYRMIYTVVRPDDPAVARIHHESTIDETGLLWPKLPHYQYPLKK